MKLISFDLMADFGFFRKPDANNTINLSYNIIHKPAVLGILGAIAGLSGYKKKGKLPEYYEKLKDLKIGIEPLEHDNGNYLKTNIKYSDVTGFNNKDKEQKPATRVMEELTLINPVYRIYILLNEVDEIHKKLLNYIIEGRTDYIPYFGKNEFMAWWNKDSCKEYNYYKAESNIDGSVKIKTVFIKEFTVKDNKQNLDFDLFFSDNSEKPFLYFERLPKDFDLGLMQYNLSEFVYSTFKIKNASNISNLYYLESNQSYVQLL